MALWTKDGKLIVDGGGKLINCDHCPCIAECPPEDPGVTMSAATSGAILDYAVSLTYFDAGLWFTSDAFNTIQLTCNDGIISLSGGQMADTETYWPRCSYTGSGPLSSYAGTTIPISGTIRDSDGSSTPFSGTLFLQIFLP